MNPGSLRHRAALLSTAPQASTSRSDRNVGAPLRIIWTAGMGSGDEVGAVQ